MKQANLSLSNVFTTAQKHFSFNFKGLTFVQLLIVNVYMFLALFFFSALLYFVFTQGLQIQTDIQVSIHLLFYLKSKFFCAYNSCIRPRLNLFLIKYTPKYSRGVSKSATRILNSTPLNKSVPNNSQGRTSKTQSNNNTVMVSMSCELNVDRLFLSHRRFPLVSFFQK